MATWSEEFEDQELTPQELEIIEILQDPVRFAAYHFDWHPKGQYQVDILHAPLNHHRIVSRCGRRIGKTECMAIHMIWYAFTHDNAVCLLAAPYENQVKLVFRRIRQLIGKSPEILESKDIDRKHPEEISFKNGSIIAGFTAGTKSGAGGASIRGQKANWIYLDEMDYLADEDIEAISAIAIEDPYGIGIWASSTPTGKRGKFWEWCTNPDQEEKWPWKEIYFPSTVLPTWSHEMEAEFRSIFRGEAYKHEVLAEFGEETVGVFMKEHVERATADYSYVKHPNYDAVRTIGVDWDKYGEATQIVVVEFRNDISNKDKTKKGMFRVIWREEIPTSERTLDNAVNKIVELNGRYRPTHIYVDRGYGEYQVEILHKYGDRAKNNPLDPAYGLNYKVKGIQFSEKIVVRDPWTKEEVKKDVKPWMVNQTQLFLERDQLLISAEDKLLRKQFLDYQVVRQTVLNRPVYTSVNEHALDATMLAVLAMSMEHPEITRILEQFAVARRMSLVGPLPQLQMRDQEAFTRGDDDSPAEEVVTSKRYSGGPTWGPRGSSGSRFKPRRRF